MTGPGETRQNYFVCPRCGAIHGANPQLEAARVPAPAEAHPQESDADRARRHAVEAGIAYQTLRVWEQRCETAEAALKTAHADAEAALIAQTNHLQNEVITLRAENARLQRELVHEREKHDEEAYKDMVVAKETAEAQGRAARAALREYGQHRQSCKGWDSRGDSLSGGVVRVMDAAKCTCGLTAALADPRPRETP